MLKCLSLSPSHAPASHSYYCALMQTEVMSQVGEFLLPDWDTWIEFLIPGGFDLTQPLLLGSFGG